MSTINHNALESCQAYPSRTCKGDVYYRYYCNSCGCLLPEGATESDEICQACKEEKIQ